MIKCFLCQTRKGERECIKQSGNMLCTVCCDSTRSWKNCPTTCRYFPKEEGPEISICFSELRPATGASIRYIADCFLPNAYEFISCNIEKLKIDFVNSHSINLSLTIVLKSTRNIIPEIYFKDSWKVNENWGNLNLSTNVYPLFFIFGAQNSTFSLPATSIKVNSRQLNIKQSLIHWNIWMPFSKMFAEDVKFNNSQEVTTLFGQGRYFRGKNLAIFSEIALDIPIEIETIIRYQTVELIEENNETKSNFGIFLPFKSVKSTIVEINPPPDFSIKRSIIEILTPRNEKIRKEFFPICSETERVLLIGSKESLIDQHKELNVNDFRLLHFINELNIDSDIEALAFVTSFPIPVSIYNSIIKLYPEKFSIAKVIVTNFSNKTLKVSVISEIQGFSHTFEDDLVINPWSQSELRITPSLISDKINGLYNDTYANLSIKIEHNGRVVSRKNTPIKLLSRNTMIWNIEDPGMSWHITLLDLVVTWVTPNIPEINTIISDAAKVIGKILGPLSYNYGDAAIEKEVEALYDVISRDIRYVNRPITFGPSDSIETQRISTPRETLTQKAGNCLDLSLLFASCLESCGIEPLIALIPGHAFVGWKGRYLEYFIEATYMGNKDFSEALEEGDRKYKKYFPKGGHREVTKGDSLVIDLKEVRDKGIFPIKY